MINFTFNNLFDRKVCPSQNHVVAESLSESSNNINMRKVLVNAQVTAMISSIESLFVIVHIAGVAIAGKKTAVTILMVMLFYMVLFLIILPYSFLMNTSHNKNRIIEHGWKNVIQNLTVNNSIFRSVNVYCTSVNHRIEIT